MAKNNGQKKGGLESDPRFSSMHTDPRFRRFPKAEERKLVVDDRFKGKYRSIYPRTAQTQLNSLSCGHRAATSPPPRDSSLSLSL